LAIVEFQGQGAYVREKQVCRFRISTVGGPIVPGIVPALVGVGIGMSRNPKTRFRRSDIPARDDQGPALLKQVGLRSAVVHRCGPIR
jgi:hypothetical protein